MINPEEVIQVKEWYTPDISRKELKSFLKRDNYHAILYFSLWFILIFAAGYLVYRLFPTAWAIPAFFFYGVVYASANAKWHECSHGTAFKTNWPNELFYFLGGSMEFRDFVDFRWSHARHHSYTIMTGVDPEIAVPRPPRIIFVLIDFFYLKSGFFAVKNLLLHSLGIPSKFVKNYVPEDEFNKMFWWARAALIPHLIAIGLSIATRSWLPVLFFTLPRFYGSFFQWNFIWLQHVGLAENVWDHRLNTRSLHVNFFLSFLFMHMENHIEHHLYPMVPFHALPKIHRRLEGELPRTYQSLWEGSKELWPVMFKQKKDPSMCIKREIPQ
jgi:fatty acid desaturase